MLTLPSKNQSHLAREFIMDTSSRNHFYVLAGKVLSLQVTTVIDLWIKCFRLCEYKNSHRQKKSTANFFHQTAASDQKLKETIVNLNLWFIQVQLSLE